MAATLGVSPQTASKYCRDPRFPYPHGPWSKKQIDEIRRWQSEYLQENRNGDSREDDRESNRSDASTDLARADKVVSIQLKTERKRKLTAEREILEKKFVKRDEHEVATARKFGAIKKSLQQTSKALKQRLADESDPLKIETMLNDAFRAIMNAVGAQATEKTTEKVTELPNSGATDARVDDRR